MITTQDALAALGNVVHPEIKQNLVDLEMIRDVTVMNNDVRFSLVLPFKGSQLESKLMQSTREAIIKLDSSLKVTVDLVEMNQQERTRFMTAAEGGPKPAQRSNQIDHTIAVLSGKGGVGKSSVTTLLAVALHRLGARVGVLDADITGPSIPKMFGLNQAPMATPEGVCPVETEHGIKVMSINLLLPDENQAVIWRGPLISNTIKQFWQDVTWGQLDYLIVDLPPGTSDASLTVMQSIPLSGIVLVTSPQDLAGMVVRKAARMAKQMKAPVLGVVENMSYIHCPKCNEKIEVFGPSRVERMTKELYLPLLGRLPLDPELALHCDHGAIESYAGEMFQPIAELVKERVQAIEDGRGL